MAATVCLSCDDVSGQDQQKKADTCAPCYTFSAMPPHKQVMPRLGSHNVDTDSFFLIGLIWSVSYRNKHYGNRTRSERERRHLSCGYLMRISLRGTLLDRGV